jgi:hypothetical protein
MKDSNIFYGGSQMWFETTKWSSKDYIIHNYGCGTIATADLFLYLALQDGARNTPDTEIALRGTKLVRYENYDSYVRNINDQYTKTKRYIAVLGTKIASAVNAYSDFYDLGYQAAWKLRLTYYDMLDTIEEMLSQDIPVILSIGPNTPNLWGKNGISFYKYRAIDFRSPDPIPAKNAETTQPNPLDIIKMPYYYKVSQSKINGHFVTVTGIIRDDLVRQVMLRISSWGEEYYINYEEYRNYIERFSDTITSSIVQIKKLS